MEQSAFGAQEAAVLVKSSCRQPTCSANPRASTATSCKARKFILWCGPPLANTLLLPWTAPSTFGTYQVRLFSGHWWRVFLPNILIIWYHADDCSTGIQSVSQQGSAITAFAWPLSLTVGENHELLLVGHADGTVSCVRVTPSGHITSEDLPHCAQPNCKKLLNLTKVIISNDLFQLASLRFPGFLRKKILQSPTQTELLSLAGFRWTLHCALWTHTG